VLRVASVAPWAMAMPAIKVSRISIGCAH